MGGIKNICAVLGFAIGLMIAPKILSKVCNFGTEAISYDYYKIVDGLISKVKWNHLSLPLILCIFNIQIL